MDSITLIFKIEFAFNYYYFNDDDNGDDFS